MRLVTCVAVFLVLWTGSLGAAPRKGTIDVESTDATADDRALFEAIARELEGHEDLWMDPPARGRKTYRLKTYARGGVRTLTETEANANSVIACKLLGYRLWRLKLRSTAPRSVTVTFRFRPKHTARAPRKRE